MVGPAHRQLRDGGEAEADAHPDLDLSLARAEDRSAAGQVDLDEAREDAVGGAPRLVRHEKS